MHRLRTCLADLDLLALRAYGCSFRTFRRMGCLTIKGNLLDGSLNLQSDSWNQRLKDCLTDDGWGRCEQPHPARVRVEAARLVSVEGCVCTG